MTGAPFLDPSCIPGTELERGQAAAHVEANVKALVTRRLFMEWPLKVLAPTTGKNVSDNRLPEGALAQPAALVGDMDTKCDFRKAKPPQHGPSSAAHGPQVICNFKKVHKGALHQGSAHH